MTKLKIVFCRNCNKSICRPSNRINENIKLRHNFYCSRKCEYQHKRKRRKLICENCGKLFFRRFSNISPHNYCSSSCAAIINNRNRPERGAKTIRCKNCGEKFKKWVVGNKKYCSRKCMGETRRRSPEELIEIIRKTAKKIKRVPTRRELRGINDSCTRIFGSWNKAILTAGFTPNRSHDDRMYKRVNAKAIDGHLCDSISEVLVDNWLYKNKISHEKNVPYPDTNHRADWEITSTDKKIFAEYFGLVNDSPRYDLSIKQKELLCKNKGVSLIAIYPKDLYPKIYLENNLKNKFRDYLPI